MGMASSHIKWIGENEIIDTRSKILSTVGLLVRPAFRMENMRNIEALVSIEQGWLIGIDSGMERFRFISVLKAPNTA